MRNSFKILLAGSLLTCVCAMPAYASTNLETSSSMAGISVVLNNFYAGNIKPEEKLAQVLSQVDSVPKETAPQQTSAAETVQATTAAQSSKYDNVAVSKVNGYVNIRSEANTSSQVTGKIYNNSAATILDTVDGEGGKWYKIQSGSVTGYIKAEYFVTGSQAETVAKEVGTEYGTVSGTPTLRLRETADLNGKTLTLLAEGAQYVVLEEDGDFLKVAVDTDLVGYVFKDYMKTSVEFQKAVSAEEEEAKAAEEAKRKQEAEEALKKLEEVKKAQETKKTTEATTKATTKAEETATQKPKETEKPSEDIQIITVSPQDGQGAKAEEPTTAKAEETTRAPETTAKETTKAAETTASKGPGGSSSSAVASATRTAIVAYAKQFLGNPYVYGGTSLTNGADCSGFVMSIYSHFGISTGRSSRDQAAKGKAISIDSVQPGDLLFYASGDYINHVAIYIGGGQVIHASNASTGICISPSNYRTPCKAVTFLD